jgi:hypothetical protein
MIRLFPHIFSRMLTRSSAPGRGWGKQEWQVRPMENHTRSLSIGRNYTIEAMWGKQRKYKFQLAQNSVQFWL